MINARTMPKKKQHNQLSTPRHRPSFDPFAGSGAFETGSGRIIRETDNNAPIMARKKSVFQMVHSCRQSFSNRIAGEHTLAAEAAHNGEERKTNNAPLMPKPQKSHIKYKHGNDRTTIEGSDTFSTCLMGLNLLFFWLWRLAPYILTLIIVLKYGLPGLPALVATSGWEWMKQLKK